MVNGKSAKGLLSLKRPNISKNYKIRRMKLKKLYKANKWYNNWKFQLHWNNLEWVNPRTFNKRNKPF